MSEEIKPTQDAPVAETKAEGPKLEWGETAPDKMTWYDAQKWCHEQGEGWRLPTKSELKAEFEKTNSTPIGFLKELYWSETEAEADTSEVFCVNMDSGWPVHYSKTSTPIIGGYEPAREGIKYRKPPEFNVRCVRGEKLKEREYVEWM